MSTRNEKESERNRKDKEERDKLDERLRRKELEKTKKLAAKQSSRDIDNVAKRMKLDPVTDKQRILELERQKSRYVYLEKRAEQQVKLLEADILDEKALFDSTKLTHREIKDLNYKQKVLNITQKQIEVSEKARIKHYLIPDKQGVKDDSNYDDTEQKHDSVHYYEQKQWEQEKLSSATISHQRHTQIKHNLLDNKADYDILMRDTEFLDRVRRGDSLEEYLIDPKVLSKEARKRERKAIEETRKALPVFQRRDELLNAIRENQVIIIQGETGCGKTTQIPQYLHEEGYTKTEDKDSETKMIGCTQPRRVAAMSVATRVSQEMGTKLGHSVGYSIRFEDCTSEGTVIKYMTDGMLLREILDDPLLEKYSVMIIDEAHERTLHTDILLTLVKDITKARPDFRLVISSATLDEQKFLSFFGNPPIFRVKGRRFEVKIRYIKNSEDEATQDYLVACLRAIVQIHRTGKPGDILVFLPGQDDIDTLQKDLELQIKKLGTKIGPLLIRPIYANLPTDQQAKVFQPTPPRTRKVVLATNIAETSITIDGIVYVVDSGYCKQNKFNPRIGMETLEITRISKASADQRAGRAGRVTEGLCVRLYTQKDFVDEFSDNTTPEIQRVNLGNVVLLLKTMRIKDIMNFDYMDQPPRDTLIFSLEQLKALGAIDKDEDLTSLGRRMAEFPLDPRMSKSIIESEKYKCSEDILTIMSMLSVNGSIFFKPKEKALYADASRKAFFSLTGDHLTLLRVYDDWSSSNYSSQWCYEKFVQFKMMCRARDIREQLEKLCERAEVNILTETSDSADIRKAILSGFFYNVARVSRQGGSYRTIRKNQAVYLHPTSSLHVDIPPRWVVFNDLVLTSKEYMKNISEIEPSWLIEVAPNFYNSEEIEELSKKRPPKVIRGRSKAELNPTYG